MKPTCPRSFEAEALRDGRLGDAERAKFERHVTTCTACSTELRALESLARALREDRSGVDELHAKRERTRLLAAFDRSLVVPERAAVHRHVVWAAVATLAALAIIAAWRLRSTTAPVAVAGAEIRPSNDTAWSKRTEGNREAVVLERGTLSIRVSHAPGAASMMVVLPDGELEDTGTTFTVSAENGRTTRVDVTEGSVVLRLRGRAAIAIEAGETWPPRSPEVTSAVASAPSSDVSPPQLAPKETPPPARPRPSATAAAVADASTDFRVAMALFASGDDTRAAAEFERFAALHSADSRVEDALYLRVIALQRSGDRTATTEAAREYLRRFPNGFRHAEVEPIAH